MSSYKIGDPYQHEIGAGIVKSITKGNLFIKLNHNGEIVRVKDESKSESVNEKKEAQSERTSINERLENIKQLIITKIQKHGNNSEE